MNYDKLYKLAFEFKKVKPWKKINESEIFAVKLSDNRIGYITITGMLNRVIMIALYIDDNVQGLLKMLFDSSYLFSTFEQYEFILTQNCLQCTFEDKDFIGEEEAEIVRKYARKYKVKIAGEKAFPFFCKYASYRVPVKLESEADTDDMCEALSAAIEITNMLKYQDKEKLGLKSVSKRTKKIIMLEKTDKGYKVGKTDFPKLVPPKYPVPSCENELAFTRLKTYENKINFECELVREMQPTVDDESGEAGFPVILFAVNQPSCFVLPVEPVLFYEDDPDKLMNAFMNSLIKFEICPSSIRAVNKKTFEFFKPFGEMLGIDVELAYEPSDVMMNLQDEYFDNLRSASEDDFDLTEEQEEQLDAVLSGLFGYTQGNLNKDELLDLLGGLGLELPENISHSLDAIQADIEQRDRFDDNLISFESMRNASDKKNKKNKVNKTYVISVSVYKGCYRHIKIPGDCTLDDLHYVINQAFDFDDEHLHVFFMDNRMWSSIENYYDVRAGEGGISTVDVTLNDFRLPVGKQFKYVFDFGDEWVFQCKVLKALDEKTEEIEVIKSVGESPEQYPGYDDDDWDEEDDDDFNPEIFPQ